MKTRQLILAWLLAYLLPIAAQADGQTLQTDADGYYLLSSADDWKAFAAIAEETPNVNARMTADIDLGDDQTMIGSVVSYQGVFNGQGHTLTVAYSNAEGSIAPFRYVEGATIEDLHVTGRIESYYVNVGGIAAIVRGDVTTVIRNCWSSSHLISGTGGIGNTIGGIASDNMGILVIEDCLFDGSFAEKNRYYNAGFVPNNWNSLTIRNSLNIGSYYSGGGTFYRTDVSTSYSSVTLDNVYYKNANGGVAQGTAVTDEQLADGTVVALLQNGRTKEIWTQGATPVLSFSDYADQQSPVLLNSVPQNGEVGVPITGSIMLTFDKYVRVSQSVAFNGKDLVPSVNGKTVVFEYFGLAYNQNYTFVIPANSVMDLDGNYVTEDIRLTFTTSELPANALLPFGQFSNMPWLAKNMQNPPDDWYQYGFDDSEWGTVVGPMARDGMWYSNTRFPYAGSYWFRRHFTMNDVDASQQYVLYVSHDDDCVVWLNGTEVLRENFYHVTSDNIWNWVSTVVIDGNLLKEGDNVLAVYVHDVGGAAFIDCGLYTDADVFIEQKGELVLELSPKHIEEGANQPVKLKLTRTVGWAQEETFMLTATTDSRVTVPATITIPARQSAAVIDLPIKDNDVLDADSIVEIMAMGDGYETVKTQLIIEDDDYPALTVKSSKSTVSEGETFQLTISTSEAVHKPLTVTLTCENPRRFTCPMQATIPAGQKSVKIDVTAKDDDIPSETLSNAFTVSASRYENSEVIVLLEDDDMPVLELTILPNKVQEGAGPVSVAGILRRTGVTNNKITVRMSDDSNSGLYFGHRELVLQKGVEEVNFNFGPIDNAQVDGNRTYTVTAAVWLSSCNCSAAGESAGSVSAQLEVFDDDGPALTLASTMITIKEGGKTMLTVGRNTLVSLDQSLTVHLSSNYDDNLSYEHTVIIPAGQQTIEVEITSNKNDVSGDTHIAVFTVQSEGFASATCYLMVTDQSLPDAVITDMSVAESEVEAGGMATVSVTVKNGGQAILPSQTHINIYVDGETDALRTLYTQEELNPGASTTISRQVRINTVPGDRRLHAIVNEEKQVAELSYNNNTSLPVAVRVLSPYRITIQSDKTRYLPGDTVSLTGSVTGSLSANAEIEVYVINEGLRQTMTVTTDNEGNFKTSFIPYERQIGHFVVGSCYPGEGLTEEQIAFDVVGIKRTSNDYITCDVPLGEAFNGSIEIFNPTGIKLQNIKARVITKPDNCELAFSAISSIEDGGTAILNFTLRGNKLTTENDWQPIEVNICSDEGAEIALTLYFYCRNPKPLLSTDIPEIITTMTIGQYREYPISVANIGKGASGKIFLSLPEWMKTATTEIASIGQGEISQIVLKMKPTDDMMLNIPVTGHIGINCENGDGIALPFRIEPVSGYIGSLVVDVCDVFTYSTESAPHVKGAQVTLKDVAADKIIVQGTTDNQGLFEVNVPEGYYLIEVSSDKHDTYSDYIVIDPERTNNQNIFLSYNAVTIEWSVVETEIEDQYDIVTTTQFDTNVPMPIVVIDGPSRVDIDSMAYNESKLLYFTLTNKGLIDALEVEFCIPSGSLEWTMEALAYTEPFTLAPKQSVLIPVRLTKLSPQSNRQAHTRTVGDDPLTFFNDCMAGLSDRYKYLCNENLIENRAAFKLALRLCGAAALLNTIFSGGGSGGDDGTKIGKPNNDKKVVEEENKQQRPGKVETICDPVVAQRYLDALNWAVSFLTGPAGLVLGSINTALDITEDYYLDGKLPYGKVASFFIEPFASITLHSYTALKELNMSLPYWWDYFMTAYEPVKTIWEMRWLDNSSHNVKSYNPTGNKYGWIAEYDEKCKLLYEEYNAFERLIEEIFGDTSWYENDDETQIPFWEHLKTCSNAQQASSLLSLKPDFASREIVESLIERFNNSNYLTRTGTNYINPDTLKCYAQIIHDYEEYAQQQGYETLTALFADAFEKYKKRLDEESSSICASVKLEINQVMTMSRPAYRGTLEVFNGHDSAAMTDARLNLVVKDERGHLATAHEFQINAESLDGFEGELDLSSGWTLEAQQTGTATVLFIPTKYAAPTEPVKYSFGGTLTYIDPFTGLEVTRDLFPVTLTVNPSPDLELTYLMQRDVYGDDPLTEEVVEPMEPAEFALIINNKGNGEAKNVRMVTEQPKITDNEKGLLIDFNIVSSQVNGAPATLSLGKTIANDFGTINAQSQAYAQWWLESTLLGHFTSYEVAANHVTSYGNQDLSLIDTVTIHEMVHGFTVDAQRRGYLVNDILDADDLPDVVYLTDATQLPLHITTEANISSTTSTTYRLIVTPSQAGWNYGSLADPTNGKQRLIGIKRLSDGAVIPTDNAWQTDRTLRDGRDWLYENRIHFVVEMNSGEESYMLYFEDRPDVELAVEQFIGVPTADTVLEEPLDEVTVRFNKPIKAESFTTDDLTLYCQGVKQNARAIVITQKNNTDYTLGLSKVNRQDGYFVLTVQTAGITDDEGFNGVDGKTASWIQFLTADYGHNFDLVITSAGYATFYDSQWNYQLPSELKAYVITGEDDHKLVYRALADDVVPQGVAVLIESNPLQEGIFTLTSTETAKVYNGQNLLRGTDEATIVPLYDNEYAYKLAYGSAGTEWNHVLGWFWGTEDGGAFYIDGHKAWLVVPKKEGTQTRAFLINGEAISDYDNMPKPESRIYDLQGRRVVRPVVKGIYIKDGHKITIK